MMPARIIFETALFIYIVPDIVPFTKSITFVVLLIELYLHYI